MYRLDKDQIEEQVKSNPTFCIMPFVHRMMTTRGENMFCCRQSQESKKKIWEGTVDYSDWSGEANQDLRERILSGERLPECKACYDMEDANYESDRQMHNERINRLDIEYVDTVTGTNHEHPVSFDLRLGNLCNLRCRMCSPWASSLILDEATKNESLKYYGYPLKKEIDSLGYKDISHIDASKIKNIKLGGGEPTIMPETLEILDKLIEANNTDIKVNITTNAVTIKKSFLEKIEPFSNIQWNFSVDGWREVNDYIRDGSSWKVVDANIKKLMELKPGWHYVNCVTQIYNIFDWFQVERWASNYDNFEVYFTPVEAMPEFDIRIMPRKWKDIALERTHLSHIKCDYVTKALESDEGYSPQLLRKLKTRTLLYDSARRKRIGEYLPYVAQMLDEIE